jgi:hypothetical protein
MVDRTDTARPEDDIPPADRGIDDTGRTERPVAATGDGGPQPSPGQMAGPTGRAPSTEASGDPDRSTIASGAAAGAGAGAIAGTAVAGPLGGAAGAVIGAAAGSVGEAADSDAETNDLRPLDSPAGQGTGLVDPATDYMDPDASDER